MAYSVVVDGYSTETLLALTDNMSNPESPFFAWSISLGLFMSSLTMLWHLCHFGYFNFGKSPFRQVKANVMLASVVLIFCSMAMFNYLAQLTELPDQLALQMAQMAKNLFGVFAIAVLGPILEEVLFRGAIQGMLMRRFNNPWVGIVLASIIFGVIHINPIQVFYAFCLGMVLGWLYYRTGSLMPSIIGHVLNNSLAAFTMYLGIEDTEIMLEVERSTEVISFILLAVVAVVMLYFINKKQPVVPVPWRAVGDEEPKGEILLNTEE